MHPLAAKIVTSLPPLPVPPEVQNGGRWFWVDDGRSSKGGKNASFVKPTIYKSNISFQKP